MGDLTQTNNHSINGKNVQWKLDTLCIIKPWKLFSCITMLIYGVHYGVTYNSYLPVCCLLKICCVCLLFISLVLLICSFSIYIASIYFNKWYPSLLLIICCLGALAAYQVMNLPWAVETVFHVRSIFTVFRFKESSFHYHYLFSYK